MYPFFFPLSKPDVRYILKLGGRQLYPVISSLLHHSKYFLDLINEVLGFSPSFEPKSSGGFIQTKTKTLADADPTLVLVETGPVNCLGKKS